MNLSVHSQIIQNVNFFISYTQCDEDWARWIAWELSRAGYSYRLQSEHFPPGAHFINEMSTWLDKSDHVLALMSNEYFQSKFATAEMNSAYATDPSGLTRRVIPIRIKECAIPALFSDLIYIDFVGKAEDEQRQALVAGLRAALLGTDKETREVKMRPEWPGNDIKPELSDSVFLSQSGLGLLRVQFFACDVGRGLDLKGQFAKIKAAVLGGRLSNKIELKPEFDVTDANLFSKLNTYRPNIVHISGNQNGGDVLFPSQTGGEVVVPDVALAGLLSSLGVDFRLAIIDTCKSYRCASRIAEAVGFAIGVNDVIYDKEATRFYEIFYQAVSAGRSLADAHGQATAALQFMNVPNNRIPVLCSRSGLQASQTFLVTE